MPNILDGLQSFYEREKLANEIEQSASEDQQCNALHWRLKLWRSCLYPRCMVSRSNSQTQASLFLIPFLDSFGWFPVPHYYVPGHPGNVIKRQSRRHTRHTRLQSSWEMFDFEGVSSASITYSKYGAQGQASPRGRVVYFGHFVAEANPRPAYVRHILMPAHDVARHISL